MYGAATVVGQNLNKLMYLVLCGVLIVGVLKCQISESGWDRSVKEISLKQQHYRVEITAAELDSFIKLWPQFKKLGFADDLIVSYQIERPSKFVDWKTKIWFVYHKWDADRFFYVQQRIASLLHTIGVRRNAKALIKLLENREDEVSKSMIDLQKKRYDAEQIDLNELNLVLAKETVLKELFD